MTAFAEFGLVEWTALGAAVVLFVLFLHIFNKVPKIRETTR